MPTGWNEIQPPSSAAPFLSGDDRKAWAQGKTQFYIERVIHEDQRLVTPSDKAAFAAKAGWVLDVRQVEDGQEYRVRLGEDAVTRDPAMLKAQEVLAGTNEPIGPCVFQLTTTKGGRPFYRIIAADVAAAIEEQTAIPF